MKLQKPLSIGISILGCFLSLIGCSSSNNKNTDYSKSDSWYMNEYNLESKKDAPADFIWFNGTSVSNPTYESGAADINDEMKSGFKALIDGGCNFVDYQNKTRIFIPYYRQISSSNALAYTKHTDLLESINASEVGIDLYNSLDYYFKNYNKDAKRPFFIGGASQGGAATQYLLEHYFGLPEHKKYLDNMIAAYSIAYGVDKCWVEANSYIKFASKADDYGVLISWVTEGVGATEHDYLVTDKVENNLIINPINWKTDDTYAHAYECKGVYENGQVVAGKYNLQYSPTRGCLICDNNQNYMPNGIWGGKSLHGYEINQAYRSIQENMIVRLNALLKAK